MKLFVTTLLASAALLSVSLPAQADTFKTKRCMNMGNALDAPKEGEWGHKIDGNAFKVIADAGFDTVRIPVRWSAHTGSGPDYRINERFFRPSAV
jgi:endoglucanase